MKLSKGKTFITTEQKPRYIRSTRQIHLSTLPKKVPAVSTSDPLLWMQTVTTGDESYHTVLIGYAEATLAGFDATDGAVIGQEVQVNMGANSADHTTIYAETLYLQAGASYDFGGKSFTIVARALGLTTQGAQPAKVSVRGADASPLATTTPIKKLTAPKPPQAPQDTSGANGAPGEKGNDGANGNFGNDAGAVELRVYTLLPSLRLIIDASGGAGGYGLAGQDGQDGQPGGDPGPDPPPPVITASF